MRLSKGFFEQDVLEVAPALLGKTLVRQINNCISTYKVTEVEAYGGIEDQASHARFGKTGRNAVMFDRGGLVYVYLIYGMYWMLNIVTGAPDSPEAVLIRGLKGFEGPGRLTRELKVDKSFYGEDLIHSNRMWLEDDHHSVSFLQKPRFGIDYAKEPWKSIPWRFIQVP